MTDVSNPFSVLFRYGISSSSKSFRSNTAPSQLLVFDFPFSYFPPNELEILSFYKGNSYEKVIGITDGVGVDGWMWWR